MKVTTQPMKANKWPPLPSPEKAPASPRTQIESQTKRMWSRTLWRPLFLISNWKTAASILPRFVELKTYNKSRRSRTKLSINKMLRNISITNYSNTICTRVNTRHFSPISSWTTLKIGWTLLQSLTKRLTEICSYSTRNAARVKNLSSKSLS